VYVLQLRLSKCLQFSNTFLFSCLDVGQEEFKSVHLFNEKRVHLVDEKFGI
jgi:hypothetical protein